MDITTLFKACVKTVRATNKHLGEKEVKTSILKPHRDMNLSKARDILKQISNLQNFLLENKAAYLNVINYLSTNKVMSEIDREKIDNAAEKIITSCTSLINDYKKEIRVLPKTTQKEEHYNSVIQSLEAYLKNVSKIYTESKAIRVKRVIEAHKLSKLETKPSKAAPEKLKNQDVSNKMRLDGSGDFAAPKKEAPAVPITPPVTNHEDELSPEDMQMFEAENAQLFNELNTISDEVRQMESKVVHIAELQELFTEKVLQQEKDIERIAETVVGSTENMRDANQQIRQAIQRNAGLRVWVLFFLLVMSFSLLFLDWYND